MHFRASTAGARMIGPGGHCSGKGLPADSSFSLDVELWPLEDRSRERTRLWKAFESWLTDEAMDVIDSVKHEGLSLYRIRCNHAQAYRLLHHRDIRTVDLPPKYGLELALVYTDIEILPTIEPPPENAPGLVILDSGLTTGHPLLAPAVGDAASFLPGKGPEDEHGHGTLVAGLALYGDLGTALQDGNLEPRLRLFSGPDPGREQPERNRLRREPDPRRDSLLQRRIRLPHFQPVIW